MLPPLSAAALFSENLVGVVLRNVFGFAPILWPFGQSDPRPRQRRVPAAQVLQPESRGVARGDNVREFHLFPRLTMNRAPGNDFYTEDGALTHEEQRQRANVYRLRA